MQKSQTCTRCVVPAKKKWPPSKPSFGRSVSSRPRQQTSCGRSTNLLGSSRDDPIVRPGPTRPRGEEAEQTWAQTGPGRGNRPGVRLAARPRLLMQWGSGIVLDAEIVRSSGWSDDDNAKTIQLRVSQPHESGRNSPGPFRETDKLPPPVDVPATG